MWVVLRKCGRRIQAIEYARDHSQVRWPRWGPTSAAPDPDARPDPDVQPDRNVAAAAADCSKDRQTDKPARRHAHEEQVQPRSGAVKSDEVG